MGNNFLDLIAGGFLHDVNPIHDGADHFMEGQAIYHDP
jgi:hypothetical protein